jgi:hypothetical protein
MNRAPALDDLEGRLEPEAGLASGVGLRLPVTRNRRALGVRVVHVTMRLDLVEGNGVLLACELRRAGGGVLGKVPHAEGRHLAELRAGEGRPVLAWTGARRLYLRHLRALRAAVRAAQGEPMSAAVSARTLPVQPPVRTPSIAMSRSTSFAGKPSGFSAGRTPSAPHSISVAKLSAERLPPGVAR